MGGNTVNYAINNSNGLSQVLADGTNSYLYGDGRIFQQSASDSAYFLGDALSSVRQLVNASGSVTLAKSYAPYGAVSESFGDASTEYGFTNEYTSQDLIYLRSRYYSSYLNQFIQPDPIVADYRNPQNLNLYSYVQNNPIRFTDPSGL